MTTAAMQRMSGAEWRSRAAAVVAAFPLAGTDWGQHSDAVESGFYSVYSLHKRTEIPAPAAGPVCEFADNVPLSPEEEEIALMLF